MAASKRFKKAEAVNQIYERAAGYERLHSFDTNNGTAQLRPRGDTSEKTQRLIDRAVAYGQMIALRAVAQDLETGYLGVPK